MTVLSSTSSVSPAYEFDPAQSLIEVEHQAKRDASLPQNGELARVEINNQLHLDTLLAARNIPAWLDEQLRPAVPWMSVEQVHDALRQLVPLWPELAAQDPEHAALYGQVAAVLNPQSGLQDMLSSCINALQKG